LLNELNSKGKLCDLIIGDSQWIGGSAENGHYVKLNDFFDKEGIKMDDFMPATVVGYSEWPKNTPNYWALPAMGDASAGPIARTGSPSRSCRRNSRPSTAAISPRPRPGTELKQIAEFFQGREIDGKKVYGASIYTERGSEGITMGVTNALYDFGFKVREPEEALRHGRLRQLARRGEGPGVLQVALRLLHPARQLQRLHVESARRLQIRPGGDADELRLLPRPVQGRECRRRQDRLLPNPAEKATGSPSSADRASRWSPIRTTRTRRCNTSSGSPSRRAEEVVGARRLFLPQGRVNAPGFAKSQPFAQTSWTPWQIVKDFWAEPSYASCCRHAEARP
jgi:multiple sugar transport system substrate-binding protein